MAEEINWDDFKVRCSAISMALSNSQDNPVLTEKQAARIIELRDKEQKNGHLPLGQATELAELQVKEKNGSKVVLSKTCIDYLMVEYAWITEGMIPTGKESLDLVAIKKGNMVEYDSLVLLTRLDKLPYKQHKDRIYNDYLSGQIDLYHGESVMQAEEIIDLKNSWDYPIYLSKIHAKIDPGHDQQVKGYMGITGARRGTVAHTLVNTPEEIIVDMQWKVAKKMNALTIESPEFITEWIKWDRSMRFDHMPIHKRIHKIKVEPFSEFERQKLYDKVKICRQWLADFHERYQKMNIVS